MASPEARSAASEPAHRSPAARSPAPPACIGSLICGRFGLWARLPRAPQELAPIIQSCKLHEWTYYQRPCQNLYMEGVEDSCQPADIWPPPPTQVRRGLPCWDQQARAGPLAGELCRSSAGGAEATARMVFPVSQGRRPPRLLCRSLGRPARLLHTDVRLRGARGRSSKLLRGVGEFRSELSPPIPESEFRRLGQKAASLRSGASESQAHGFVPRQTFGRRPALGTVNP